MMKTLDIKAPAKINLTLEVLARRRDGFHEIRSVMQTIGWYDSLRIEPGTGIEYICHDPVWQPEKSLVPKAVNLLIESTGTNQGAVIGINKRIPLVSGLGGESSLAAAVLHGLNQFWELNITLPQLKELAARLGSDVPFFLQGGTALAQGRGEIINPLPPMPVMWVVLLVPPVPEVPEKTARLYARLEKSHYTGGQITERLVACLKQGSSLLPSMFFNVFDSVAPEVFPGLEAYRRRFLAAGAEMVHLAGAGPAIFTLIGDKVQAKALYHKLEKQGLESYLTATRVILD